MIGNWHWGGMHWWGFGIMGIGMLLFWALLIVGIIALTRYVTQSISGGTTVIRSTPEQLLTERFARGEIDDEEFLRRLRTMNAEVDPASSAR